MNAESSVLAAELTGRHRTGRVSGAGAAQHRPRIEQVERRHGHLRQETKPHYIVITSLKRSRTTYSRYVSPLLID